MELGQRMQKVLNGAVGAVVVAGAIFALSGCNPQKTSTASGANSPDTIAQQIKPGFTGVRQIGNWTLRCVKTVTLLAGPPGHQRMITFPAPAHPCRVGIKLDKATSLADVTEAAFARLGPKSGLVFIVRFQSKLIPQPAGDSSPTGGPNTPGGFTRPMSVDPSEKVDLRLTGGGVKFPVRVCGPMGCAAVLPINPEMQSSFLATQKLVIGLPSNAGQKQLVFDAPVAGM